MAWQLFRLGRWSFRRRWTVTGIWALLLLTVALGAATLSEKTNDGFELSGIESTQAFDLIRERDPEAVPNGATARVVFQAPDGETLADPANQQAVADSLAALRTEHVLSIVDPFEAGAISEDGRTGFASVSYARSAADLSSADREALEAARDVAEQAGLTATVGGDVLGVEIGGALAELIGIAIAFVVLALTLGSLVAAGMPLLTALIGVGIGTAAIAALTGFVELSTTTPALGTMLGLAVGIDYALFILSRYQAEIRQGRPLEEAAGRAVGTAGSAVVFAGLTVVIALVGLALCGIGFLTEMGLGAAFTVALAVFIALTLLPALLGFAGARVVNKRTAAIAAGTGADQSSGEPRTLGRRWVEGLARVRWPALVAGIAVAAVASIPVASLQLALPDDSTKPAGSDVRVAYDLIDENFGAGANGPLLIVIDTAQAPDPAAAVATATEMLQTMAAENDSNVAAVIPAIISDSPEAQQAFMRQLDTAQYATLTVIPRSGPSDQSTKELVADIRDTLSVLPDQNGARALITGVTAVGVDISNELTEVFPLYLAVVVGLALILLIAVFRSIWVPVKAALGFLFSVGVSLGATVAVFQWGWLNELVGLDASGPVLFLLPILLTGILFGLAMDYEVFLVTRMREAYVHGVPARQAVIDGFTHSARVVAAAALIMVGVFAGFTLTDDIILKTIGFALAIGVLVDAFLVRMLIVPATMLILGRRIWWMPRWMNKVVPTLDVEGESLARHLAAR
ncbi:MMPL family transporter [Micromonospora craniellae]|uniref:MMPL family transporter n=1 Tax=Micromonospora craniellae TaxID=2294034 RepID=A0A372FUP3_9ACTN|nr:MMPL family transporter [Micromonospora craniellae]QOC95089.1 MMPL family transporter [Micromonospora craniellae]RFS44517.1 MMPL family transporter [Micromonospora craniellae]